MNRNLLNIFFLFFVSLSVAANVRVDSVSMALPFNFPLLLSGNFGELRSNHFHAGVDFKTQGTVGKPIYSPESGYISRVTVSSGGYGRAVYVVHDNGLMTVYGHLDKFLPEIADTVRRKQYLDEAHSVDLNFLPHEYPVKKGDLLAYAGNSGYSFGPHLHFEIRTADNKKLLNPMLFYKNSLNDGKSPIAKSVMITPRRGVGVVDGLSKPFIGRFTNSQFCDTVAVWGSIAFSIKADDFMDNTNNRYGIYRIELYVDDSLRFESQMDSYPIADTRLINAWAEYEHYYNTGEWFLRSYILENNTLSFLSADRNSGWLNVDEERVYNIRFRLTDYHGNSSIYTLAVKGVQSAYPSVDDIGDYYLLWYTDNEVVHSDLHLEIPRDELFENTPLSVKERAAVGAVSRRYDLGCHPLRNKARLSIRVADSLRYSPEKYYMRRITRKGEACVGGKLYDGWLVADVKTLGCYDVAVDTFPPIVKPVNEKRWKNSGNIVFSVTDKGCGIKNFKGYIDGEFVLFEYNSMRKRLTCNMSKEKIKPGKHKLKLVVTDGAGNVTVVEKNIK